MGRQSHIVRDTVRGKIPDWLRRRSETVDGALRVPDPLTDSLTRMMDPANNAYAINNETDYFRDVPTRSTRGTGEHNVFFHNFCAI